MKSSQIYRKAAEIVNRGDYLWSCLAIANATWETTVSHFPLVDRYEALFSPEKPTIAYWGRLWGPGDDEKAKECRVLALLLMSAIAESEGD